MAKKFHVQPRQQISSSNSGIRMRPSMRKITLGFFGCINPELVGLTGCEEQRDRLKREKDMHLLWYPVFIITIIIITIIIIGYRPMVHMPMLRKSGRPHYK